MESERLATPESAISIGFIGFIGFIGLVHRVHRIIGIDINIALIIARSVVRPSVGTTHRCMSFAASSASSGFMNVTKPKPLVLPVSRSVGRYTSSISPYLRKSVRICARVARRSGLGRAHGDTALRVGVCRAHLDVVDTNLEAANEDLAPISVVTAVLEAHPRSRCAFFYAPEVAVSAEGSGCTSSMMSRDVRARRAFYVWPFHTCF